MQCERQFERERLLKWQKSKWNGIKVKKVQNWRDITRSISVLKGECFVLRSFAGEMDEPTIKVMNLPRCGVPDILAHNSTKESQQVDRVKRRSRTKRFSLQGSKWSTTGIDICAPNFVLPAFMDVFCIMGIPAVLRYTCMRRFNLQHCAIHERSQKAYHWRRNRARLQGVEWVHTPDLHA